VLTVRPKDQKIIKIQYQNIIKLSNL